MSLFFEDVKNTSNGYLVEDVSGALSVALESEMSWNNIETSMIKTEAMCVIKEDAGGLKEAASSFFTKAKQFFIDLWNRFVQALNNLKNKLVAQASVGEKFIQKNEDALAHFNGSCEAKTYKWKNFTLSRIVDSDFTKVCAKIAGKVCGSYDGTEISADDFAKEFSFGSAANIDKELLSKIRNDSKDTVSYSSSNVNEAVANIKQFKGTLKGLNDIAKSMKDTVATGKTSAERGISEKDDNKRKKHTAVIKSAKAATLIISKITNVYTKIVTDLYIDSCAVVRAGVAGNSKNASKTRSDAEGAFSGDEFAEKKDKKDDDIKNDSYFQFGNDSGLTSLDLLN